MAEVKSSERYLPITDITRPFFERQKDQQVRQRTSIITAGGTYYDGDLVVCNSDGSWKPRGRVSADFGQLLRHLELRHIRFHDSRHSIATNMHELTGDFYTVGQCLGHSLKGVGIQLNISNNLDSVTAQYVDVRLERKRFVLETYHNAVFPSTAE